MLPRLLQECTGRSNGVQDELKQVKGEVKHELLQEAWAVNHLGDHRDLPLLFGTVIKGEQLMVVMQFRGEKGKSVTLSMAI